MLKKQNDIERQMREMEERKNAKKEELSIVGDKDEFLAEAAKRLEYARLRRPWERLMESKSKEFGISDARRKFPSLRHLEKLNVRRDAEKELERRRKEAHRRDMESFDRAWEQEEKNRGNAEALRRGEMTRKIEQFRHSPKGQELTAMLDAHQRENKIRNITGEERLSLKLPKSQFSTEDRMLLEALRGNKEALQNLQERRIDEDKLNQSSLPVAIQQPIEQDTLSADSHPVVNTSDNLEGWDDYLTQIQRQLNEREENAQLASLFLTDPSGNPAPADVYDEFYRKYPEWGDNLLGSLFGPA